ncbi:GMC family oxidoreductase [Corticibacter populi]|uniref:GMC family oxidoreductase n=1 Tax=Corticibacter populi TaxID=1550736 RepID=A0A3M6QPU5_9BURK|nr:GMC family oxidoreductase N-terminal domain-containing protein [Corticibacter populi]RMX04811.1 GMC family oxidoreductase [Corticibacter populi]RZS33773.1 choline dehydrogenase [Corticibacter populi]
MSQPRELLPSYDYVVCGGGAAGCVVASRLAQDSDATVLLLEAGGDERVPAVEDSRLWMSNIGGERDWRFVAEASPHTAGRRLPLPMGRVLGGGSSTNGLIWARGHRNDFELWARESGDARWSYEQVLQVYKRIENWQGTPDPQRRGTDGPMFITKPQDPVPVAQALARACVAAGIPEVDDLNGAAMEGDGACGIANVNVAAGARRVSVAGAYLRPAMARPNLTVLLHAQVRRLVLDGQTVKGVEFSHRGQVLEVAVDAEAVLCTGAINTPKILMLSGIGDRAELARHGIECRHHLPGVGANFQDHILVAGCVWEYQTPEPPRNNAAEFTLFWKSRAGLDRPDLQPVLEECAFGSEVTGPAYGLPSDRAAAWTLAPGLVRPQSRGRVRLASADPDQAPRVEANFLSAPEDVQALMACVKLCRELGNAPELAPFRRRELMPGDLDDKASQAWLRQAAGTYFHQSGTARMGQGDDAVVDGALRVHGVQGLRVADASIMPEVTTGNTHAPCVLIGEQAAQGMLEAHRGCGMGGHDGSR